MGFLRKQWTAISPNAKWDAVKLAGAAIIAAAYGLLQKARHLSSDWYVFGFLFVISAFLFFRLGKTKKNKEAELDPTQTASKEERDDQAVASYAAALNREVASLHEKLKDCNEKRQMPRPYLEVLDTTQSMPITTEFMFTNRGGDVAHKVQVQPLEIHSRP
jgi:hypothetical protein